MSVINLDDFFEFGNQAPINRIAYTKEDAEYEIISVFLSRVYYKSETNVFRYYYFVNAEDREKLLRCFNKAEENQNGEAVEYVHFVRTDGKMLWVRFSIHFLRVQDGHRIYYGSLLDLTELQEKKETAVCGEYEAEELTERQWRHIEKYYGEFPRGCVLLKPVLDEEHKVKDCQIIYANREVARITGSNVDRMQFMVAKAFAHRKEELFDKMYRTAYLGEKFDITKIKDIDKEVNIKEHIKSFELNEEDSKLILETVLSSGTSININPMLLIGALVKDTATDEQDVDIIKVQSYTDTMEIFR